MIFTRRFGALAARPQFPDAPELQELNNPVDLDAEIAELTAQEARRRPRRRPPERGRVRGLTSAYRATGCRRYMSRHGTW